MTRAVAIPKLGLTMEEAVVIEWGHADRARVSKGDVLITIETDKIMFDVEAEQDGYLQRVAEIGATLAVAPWPRICIQMPTSRQWVSVQRRLCPPWSQCLQRHPLPPHRSLHPLLRPPLPRRHPRHSLPPILHRCRPVAVPTDSA